MDENLPPSNAAKPKKYSVDWEAAVAASVPKWKPPAPKNLPHDSLIVKQITPDEWSALSEKARWDSIVALRGPDLVHSDTLKYFTASVIRWKLSSIMRVGGLVNRSAACVVLPRNLNRSTSSFDACHFIGHISEAANWLSIPIVYASDEVWTQMLKGGSANAIRQMLSEDENIPENFRLWFKETSCRE